MRKPWIVKYLPLLSVSLILAGCQKPATTAAKPKSKPTPPPLSALSTGFNLTVFDQKGLTVLGLKAATAGANSGGNTGTVEVQKGNATLFQKGKEVAILTAEKILAHQDTGTIEATGNVIVKSLAHTGSPTVRADRMVWEPDKNLLTGSGNVLITEEPTYFLPGKSFTADTKLSHYKMELGTTPGGGTY